MEDKNEWPVPNETQNAGDPRLRENDPTHRRIKGF